MSSTSAAPGAEPGPAAGLHVLRLSSVFEPEGAELDGRSARFDPIGGLQNHTGALTRCLDRLGVRQTVVTSRLAGPRGTSRLGNSAEIRRVGLHTGSFRQLWALCGLPGALTARGVSVVHAHQGEDVATLLLALAACRVHRASLVVTLHCSVRHTISGGSPRAWLLRLVGGAVERAAIARAAAVIVLVPRAAALLRRDGVPADRVHVLPSGFDPDLFAEPGPDPFERLPRPRVGYVGRLAEQKRPDVLVRAFGQVSPPASLVVVGDGPLRPTVTALAEASPARERITITGFLHHDAVPAVLAAIDLLVLPSAYEEMGSVLVEALASGVPVVASRVGGIPDVIEDGRTGLLVPPGDVPALAEALTTLLADPARLEQMGAEARRASVRYCWPDLARRAVELYAAAVGAPVPARR